MIIIFFIFVITSIILLQIMPTGVTNPFDIHRCLLELTPFIA